MPSSLGRWLDAPFRKLLTQRDFPPPCSSRGEVVSQPLRPGLADVQLSADHALVMLLHTADRPLEPGLGTVTGTTIRSENSFDYPERTVASVHGSGLKPREGGDE